MKILVAYQAFEYLKIQFQIVICVLCCVYFSSIASAQTDTNEKMYHGVILDEVMVKATHAGFDVPAFIEKVKNDTTFYKAFKTLRLMSYDMYNDIVIEDKNENTKASYISHTRQEVKNHCRTMNVLNENTTGKFYTNEKDYTYYTAKLYAHLFFTKGKICNEHNIVGNGEQQGSTKYEEQLRLLIFNPGKHISGIPGIGNNVEIFNAPYMSKYNFYLSRIVYNNEDCYVFKAIPKNEYKNDVVINVLNTWFRVSDNAIVARDYSLSYKTFVYDFDVNMHVKLKSIADQLVPYEITYKGNWHVVTQPREIATFTAIFTDFKE